MYFVVEEEKVRDRGQFPEFLNVLRDLESRSYSIAGQLWEGYSPGGLLPGNGQFGAGPMRKNDMARDTTDSQPSGSYTFNTRFGSVGWQDVFNYTVRNNQLHAFAGFKFTDDVLRVTQVRMEIGPTRFPVWDIQSAQNFDKYSLIFKTDEGKEMIARPTNRVLIRMYAESTGIQRIVPIGLSLFKDQDLVLEEI